MSYNYDINEIKESLTIEQIFDLLTELHGEPIIKGNMIISKTICHHSVEDLGEASHKLYYYDNTHLFRCYTGCGDSFDIFELIRKVKNYGNENNSLPKAISFVANYFNFTENEIEEDNSNLKEYLNSIKNYSRVKNYQIDKQIVELKVYKDDFLKNLPHPIIKPWIEENISEAAMKKFEIAYDPKNEGIVIPHRDIKGNLIGIRARFLNPSDVIKGKYRPLYWNKVLYNHPVGRSLYGIYENQKAIRRTHQVIIFEGEKSTLKRGSIYGINENNAVATLGQNITRDHISILTQLGVRNVILAYDSDYEDEKQLKEVEAKYYKKAKILSPYFNVSYLMDYDFILPYKSSPIDGGREAFEHILKKRQGV